MKSPRPGGHQSTHNHFGMKNNRNVPFLRQGDIAKKYNLSNSLKINGPAPQYWRGIELRIQYKLSSNSLSK